MHNNLGYTKPLFILAFDHRSSFIKNMLGSENKELNQDESEKIIELKQMIYEGFKQAVLNGLPKEQAAILVDEQFGDNILHTAKSNGFITALTCEKSGQEEFDFEYGSEFSSHIEKYKPVFVKVLVRFNPEANPKLNIRQLEKLKILNDYCHNNSYKFLVETLLPPTKSQMNNVGQDKTRYDQEIRPGLVIKMIAEFQNNRIEPDIWKIEGMADSENYRKVVNQARNNGRDNVGMVILGRGEDAKQVERWLAAAKDINGVVGFAIGRTIFMEPLINYNNDKINREQAIGEIAKNYMHFYNIFTKNL